MNTKELKWSFLLKQLPNLMPSFILFLNKYIKIKEKLFLTLTHKSNSLIIN